MLRIEPNIMYFFLAIARLFPRDLGNISLGEKGTVIEISVPFSLFFHGTVYEEVHKIKIDPIFMHRFLKK